MFGIFGFHLGDVAYSRGPTGWLAILVWKTFFCCVEYSSITFGVDFVEGAQPPRF